MFIHLNLFPLLHTRPTQLFQTNAKIQALGFPWYAKKIRRKQICAKIRALVFICKIHTRWHLGERMSDSKCKLRRTQIKGFVRINSVVCWIRWKLSSWRFVKAQLYSCPRIFWTPSWRIFSPEFWLGVQHPCTEVPPGVNLNIKNSPSQTLWAVLVLKRVGCDGFGRQHRLWDTRCTELFDHCS